MTKSFPNDAMQQAQSVLQGWKAIGNTMVITDLTQTAMEEEIRSIIPLLEQISSMDAQLTDVRNQRDAVLESVWSKVKRVRAGVKANYGDDSSQYEMVGGKRLSERKPATRTKPPTTS